MELLIEQYQSQLSSIDHLHEKEGDEDILMHYMRLAHEEDKDEEDNDDDVLLVEDAIEVRQDQGVQFEHTELVPSAPDLDALTQTAPESPSEQEWPVVEEEPEQSDWSDNWFKNLEEE